MFYHDRFVNWADGGFNAGGGAGASRGYDDTADVANLMKAMTAGSGKPTAGSAVPGALQPLMPESLEATLKVLTYTEREFKFWRSIFKSAAYNTSEEYNRLHAVGSGEAAWIGEGDLPEEEDSTYSREVVLMKFLGTTRRVSHVASLVKTVGIANAIAQETKNGTLWLMRNLEWGLWYADSRLIPVHFDGMKALMDKSDTPVVDLRGAALTEQVVNDVCSFVRGAPNYGFIDTLWCSVGVKSDVVNLIRANQRAAYGGVVTAGAQINEIMTQACGAVKLEDSVFITEGDSPFPNGTGQASKRPLAPIMIQQPTEAVLGGGESSNWIAGDLGNYYYKIVALNRYGRSTPVTTAVVAVGVAGRKVTIIVQDGGQNTTAYIVYRSTKNGAADTCREAFKVAKGAGNQTTITDFNNDLPGCSDVFGLESDPNTYGFKQLAPFTRIPLATIDLSIRWMQVLYGAPVLYRPRHVVRFKNCGRSSGAVIPTKAKPGFE